MNAHMNGDGGVEAGAAYLVLGSIIPASRSLGAADAQFTGEIAGDQAGNSVAGTGDLDGDGKADIVIGAFHSNDGADFAGAAYVVLGESPPASLDLSRAGAKLRGDRTWNLAGMAVAAAGDTNADGYDDVLVSAPYTSEGTAYLLMGFPP